MSNKKGLTKNQKVYLVANMPEITNAMKVLAALMQEAKIKNFVEYEYVINEEKYKFKFEKIKKS